MARMKGIEEGRAGWMTRFIFASIRRHSGSLAETWRIVAHAPNVLRAWASTEYFLDRSRIVDMKLKKLVQLKVAVIVGCPF
jgi:hypothetical protein